MLKTIKPIITYSGEGWDLNKGQMEEIIKIMENYRTGNNRRGHKKKQGINNKESAYKDRVQLYKKTNIEGRTKHDNCTILTTGKETVETRTKITILR